MFSRAKKARRVAAETGSAAAKRPRPLTPGERVAAAALCIAGLIVIGVTLFAVSSVDSDFTFKAKEKTVTKLVRGGVGGGGKPAGDENRGARGRERCKQKQTAQQRKRCHRKHQRRERQRRQRQREARLKRLARAPVVTAREVDYSDTFAIFALTVGAGLALGGAFYGRLRSMKLGNLELGLVDPEVQAAAAEQAQDKVEAKIDEKATATSVSESDRKTAKELAKKMAIADINAAAAAGVKPTDQAVEGIADQAAEKVVDAFV